MAENTGRPDDPTVTGGTEAERRSAAARLFDVRRVIGGLFVAYGLIVTAIGAFDSADEIAKAQGVRINLWMGLSMLGVGLIFLLWQWRRPAQAPSPPEEGDAGPGAGAR